MKRCVTLLEYKHIYRLVAREDGAVTADFVILSASVIMIAISFGTAFSDGMQSLLDAVTQLINDGAVAVDSGW
ncbi:hypothetical protein [Albimonas pacifica]|uniref:Flp pilus assembly protein, pilin Flp n=1 Tax=Albimonas pacifica TaxID=1114924 RepID=A0A1I3N222_9RHOB|nr:hypothetical protein [Albimonas pacifica]SFJ03323.1 hypothetical protein SAMN05216258_11297 [Albimonas pacifica]